MRLRYLSSAVVVAMVACHSDPPTNNAQSAHCKTTFDYEPASASGWSSPTTGYLTLTGSFYPDETVYLQYVDNSGNTRTANGTVASARNSITLNGLPSGARSFVTTVSCADGIDDSHVNGNFTIK
jgi:hypothetical protein